MNDDPRAGRRRRGGDRRARGGVGVALGRHARGDRRHRAGPRSAPCPTSAGCWRRSAPAPPPPLSSPLPFRPCAAVAARAAVAAVAARCRVPAASCCGRDRSRARSGPSRLAALLWRSRRAAPRPGVHALAGAAPGAGDRRCRWRSLVFAGAWMTARPRVPAGDEPHYLVITQSLLYDGDLRIENNHQQDQYLAYYDGVLKPDFMRRGVDRQIYSIHAPGVAALVLPAFAAVGYPGAVGTVIAAIGRRHGGGVAGGVVAHRVDRRGVGGVAGAGRLGAAGAARLRRLSRSGRRGGGRWPACWRSWRSRPARRRSSARGWAAGWRGPGAAALAAHALRAAGRRARRWRLSSACAAGPTARRALAAFAAVPLVAAAGWLAYFWRIYGTPNPAAPYGARPEGGLGVHSGRSHRPALRSAVRPGRDGAGAARRAWPAWCRWPRQRPRLAIEVAAIVVPYLLRRRRPTRCGGAATARRAASRSWSCCPRRCRWRRCGATGGSAAASSWRSPSCRRPSPPPSSAHDRGAFIYNGRDGHALLLDWLSPTVDLTLGAPSVHRDGALAAAGDAAIWLAAGAVVAGLWLLLARRRPHGAGPRWPACWRCPWRR